MYDLHKSLNVVRRKAALQGATLRDSMSENSAKQRLEGSIRRVDAVKEGIAIDCYRRHTALKYHVAVSQEDRNVLTESQGLPPLTRSVDRSGLYQGYLREAKRGEEEDSYHPASSAKRRISYPTSFPDSYRFRRMPSSTRSRMERFTLDS